MPPFSNAEYDSFLACCLILQDAVLFSWHHKKVLVAAASVAAFLKRGAADVYKAPLVCYDWRIQ